MCLGVIKMMDRGLSKEDYNMLEEMSQEYSEITTAGTVSLLKSTYTIYNKEELNYGRKVRFNRREIQEVSCQGG